MRGISKRKQLWCLDVDQVCNGRSNHFCKAVTFVMEFEIDQFLFDCVAVLQGFKFDFSVSFSFMSIYDMFSFRIVRHLNFFLFAWGVVERVLCHFRMDLLC